MDFLGLLQVNSIQIGQDKHLTLLVHNQQKTRLEGSIFYDMEDFSSDPEKKEEKSIRVDIRFSHKTDENDPIALHKWDFLLKFSTLKRSNVRKVILSLSRKELNGPKWKVSNKSIKYLFDLFVFFLNIT